MVVLIIRGLPSRHSGGGREEGSGCVHKVDSLCTQPIRYAPCCAHTVALAGVATPSLTLSLSYIVYIIIVTAVKWSVRMFTVGIVIMYVVASLCQ